MWFCSIPLISGAPTNFGLKGNLQHQWQQQIADVTRGDYVTTYGGSYTPHPASAGIRYATPKAGSTTLHAYNKVNKDINLRGLNSLQAPEPLPSMKPISTATPQQVV